MKMNKVYFVGIGKYVRIVTKKNLVSIGLFEDGKLTYAIGTKDMNEAIDKIAYLTWALDTPFNQWEVVESKELLKV